MTIMVTVAVATVLGEAYYKLVKELKRRGLPFMSLKPRDNVPLTIKVVITTERERHLVKHSNVLVFKDEIDAATIVNDAVRVIHGKKRYEKVVIGVDPGKTFGIAIRGDGKDLETVSFSSLQDAVNLIVRTLAQVPAKVKVVKVGDGSPIHAEALLRSLDEAVSKEVKIEVVREAGTSQHVRGATRRRGLKDAVSAKMIAERKGRVIHRRRRNEASCGKGQNSAR